MRLRSARALIWLATGLLIALPLVMLAFAYVYERMLVRSERRHLEQLAKEFIRTADLTEAARAAHVSVRWLGADGTLRLDSHTDDLAVQQTLITGLLNRAAGDPLSASLGAIEQELGPLAARPEVRRALGGKAAFAERAPPGGLLVLFTLAVPAPEGGALVFTQASRRGVRRLLVLRRELVQVTAYSSSAALLLALLLIRRLIRPLESLASAARTYPATPLAEPALLERIDELGDLARAITHLARDLDARRRATADLGADIAHALKNPLAALRAAAELLDPASSRELTGERRRLIATRVEESVDRLQRALDDLLHLLRIESELSEEPRERLPYAAFLEQILDEYRRDPQLADWTLRAEVSPEVGEVWLIAERWRELLRNLLDNALCQPPTRREIHIRAFRAAAEVVTEVSDCGPGIPAADRDKIFRRFFTRRPAGQPAGTGLGLSIVQSIAKAHGGQVTLASPPGEGATFRITLPTPQGSLGWPVSTPAYQHQRGDLGGIDGNGRR
jgi:two-component system sensor histidine kinase ChvG